MTERIIHYVYLLHLSKHFENIFSEEIKYGEFFSPVAFSHEMRYRFENWGNWIKDNKKGLSGPKSL